MEGFRSSHAHYHYSYFLAELGRFDEAIHEATEALSRDPMSALLNAGLAFVLMLSSNYDRGIAQALTAVEVDPHIRFPTWFSGWHTSRRASLLQQLKPMKEAPLSVECSQFKEVQSVTRTASLATGKGLGNCA